MKKTILTISALAFGTCAAFAETVSPGDVSFEGGVVMTSLTGVAGDPASGRKVMNKGSGNCIACHQVSELTEWPFHGEIGPVLDGAASRWSEAELRGIVTNAKMTFEGTMMPAFYKSTGYIRPGNGFSGKAAEGELEPLLSAQQVEDVVAYLLTLTE